MYRTEQRGVVELLAEKVVFFIFVLLILFLDDCNEF